MGELGSACHTDIPSFNIGSSPHSGIMGQKIFTADSFTQFNEDFQTLPNYAN
jgi:hypothetical protein